MRVFKKTTTAKKWTIELRDHLDIVRRFPGLADKDLSESLGRRILDLVNNKASTDPLTPELIRCAMAIGV